MLRLVNKSLFFCKAAVLQLNMFLPVVLARGGHLQLNETLPHLQNLGLAGLGGSLHAAGGKSSNRTWITFEL
ncbi:MAG: hypothetical protein VX670_11475, partial [Candidatus Latescibacterota bacterium]|nr:hypothetical protein [Candidatus Latescibacterota bacterium]